MSNLTVALYGQEREDYINQRRLNREKNMQSTTRGIVDTLTRFRFVEEFRKIRPDNFSYEGLHALFDYFEDLSHDIGQPIEFDPIAICCDYTEYESFKQFQEVYGIENYSNDEMINYIEDNSEVINVDNGNIIIRNF